MKKIDLMVFDLDGTLVDSSLDLVSAANYTRMAFALSPLEEAEAISFVGDGTDKLVERLLGEKLQHRHEEALELFINYYEDHLLDNTTLYPGVIDVLKYFGKKKKIILTNKRYNLTKKITDGLGISDYFLEIIGVGSTPFRKPDVRVVLPLLEKFDSDPQRTVMIGDGAADAKLAASAGIQSCAVLNGFTPRNTLLSFQPDFTCEDLRDLKKMFY